MRSIKLLILILLLSSISSYGQIQPADSNHVIVDKLEFKYICNVFNDYNALREINKQLIRKNDVLERIINDKDQLILLKEEDNQFLKQTIEDISPAWYDRFLIGVGATVVAIFSILLLLK